MRVRTPALLLTAALALTACGGGDTDESTDAPPPFADGTVEFVGNQSVQWADADRWADDAVDAVAVGGALEVTLTCEGAVPHNVVIEGVQGDEVLAECAGDDSATATVDLEPGSYTFYCAIPGHRAAGMEGTLVVG